MKSLSLKKKIKRNIKKILSKIFKDVNKKLKDMNKKLKESEKREQDLKRKLIQNEKKLNYITEEVKALKNIMFAQYRGINGEEREKKIIISLTSFPGRIHYVHEALENLFIQTMKPDKIILWLSEEQFPNKYEDLPPSVMRYIYYGLEIKWCKGDIKSYKKILPALKEYPDDLIIIVDDDLTYDLHLVEELYWAHLKYPAAIIASRVHRITLDEDNVIEPYLKWEKECAFVANEARDDWFFTGGAGTLFPPNAFGSEIFDEDVIMEMCPYADDIWLNIHAAIAKTPIVNIKNKIASKVEGTQVEALYDINRTENDNQLKAVVAHYSDKLNDSIYRFVISKDIAEY